MFGSRIWGVNRAGAWGRSWDRLLSLTILPPVCALCGARDVPGPADLCTFCAQSFPRLGDCCPRCAMPRPTSGAPGGTPHCEACLRRAPEFDRAVVPFHYAWPVDRLVRGLKFEGRRPFARLLGLELAAARAALDAPWPEALVPLPLHPRRFRERGFNQAEEIARHAARALRLPLATHALERALPTREQTGLTAAERRRNVRHAFRMRRPLAGMHIALLDDVLTTGSTAGEAARALKSGGAARVELWAVARAALAPVQERSEYSSRMPTNTDIPT